MTVVPTETAVRHAPAAPSSGSGPATRRWGGLAAAAIVAVVLALAAVILVSDRGGEEGATATSTPTTTLTPDDTTGSTPTTALTTRTTVVPAATVPTTPTAPTTTVQGVRLGQALAPVSTEPCRSPSTASGAAWQISPVQLGGRPFDAAYNCNLFAGGTGSLDFVLGNSYRLLTTSIGFADGSTSTGHVVRFEFIGDGRENLIEPTTVRFGNVQNLQVDVSGVTRLKIRITELSPPGGTEGASKPVLATPTLTPV